jgi:hypothetical protein
MDRYTRMTPVCLPDPPEDEPFHRLHHAELREWLTKAILLLPEQERSLHPPLLRETDNRGDETGAGRDRIQHFSASRLRLGPPPRKPSGSSQLCTSCRREDRADNSIAPLGRWACGKSRSSRPSPTIGTFRAVIQPVTFRLWRGRPDDQRTWLTPSLAKCAADPKSG